MNYLLQLEVFLFGILFCQLLAPSESAIINQNVERAVDVSSKVVKETLKLTAEDDAGKSFKQYSLLIPEDWFPHLAYISARNFAKKQLTVQRGKLTDNGIEMIVHFPTATTSQIFFVELVYTDLIKPYPEFIKQSEKQFVKYNGFIHFYSPYATVQQKTQVKLSSANVISYTQLKPYNLASNKIKYGPYANIPAFSKEPFVVHVENSMPFVTIDRLERTIMVSHWGTISVEEQIQMTHTGAKLKGSFSRYEFQKDGRSGQSALKSYKTNLPASAFGVYYRDMNGNISTSNMNVLKDYVELELRPRYPLFGGWKTQYTLGYYIPSFEYLFYGNDVYTLKMRAIDHVFDDMVIKEAVVKIILPEGAFEMQLKVPYEVQRHNDTISHVYLDTFGRPTLIFSKENMVENHIEDFTLKYKFNKLMLLQESLLIIGFIFSVFVFSIICKRLDFSIGGGHAHKD